MQKLFSDIDNYLSAEDRLAFRVRLDAAHPVYAGHFPGNPVLPGVCTLQIVRECLERGTGRRHRFTAIRECKFLGMIVPQADTLLDIDIRLADDGTAAKKVTCVVTNNEKRFSNSRRPPPLNHDERPERHTGGDPDLQQRKTVARVIADVRRYCAHVLVVNDGSTDSTAQILAAEGVKTISYAPNRGKGYAIRRALRHAGEHGYRYMITIDSDGQHFASDIPKFVEEIEKTPDALLVGARNLRSDNMPGKNTFANKFSNFWFRVETGMRLDDTQSGFRLYPVRRMKGMRFLTRRYEFEVEVLVRAAWRGIAVRNIPVNVFYPEKSERVTHFRPGKDFTRISILNTFLMLGALLFYYPWRFLRSLTKENIRRFVTDNITRSRDSNPQLAASIGLGIFFGIAPLWGYQMIAAGVTAHFTRLNKAVAILSSNISIPPMIPFILYGSYWTGAQVLRRGMPLSLSDITLERAAADMFQYVVGSFVMAAVCAVAAAAVSYALLVFCKRTPRHE